MGIPCTLTLTLTPKLTANCCKVLRGSHNQFAFFSYLYQVLFLANILCGGSSPRFPHQPSLSSFRLCLFGRVCRGRGGVGWVQSNSLACLGLWHASRETTVQFPGGNRITCMYSIISVHMATWWDVRIFSENKWGLSLNACGKKNCEYSALFKLSQGKWLELTYHYIELNDCETHLCFHSLYIIMIKWVNNALRSGQA